MSKEYPFIDLIYTEEPRNMSYDHQGNPVENPIVSILDLSNLDNSRLVSKDEKQILKLHLNSQDSFSFEWYTTCLLNAY